jgi:hypothetical protein
VKFKQLSPEVVIRAADGVQVPPDDPDFLAWVGEGNSPFPPDDQPLPEVEA